MKYRCVQGSFAASALNALSMRLHRSVHSFDSIDTFICPTAVMAEKMQLAGLFASRFTVLPTFASVAPVVKRERLHDAEADQTRSTHPICYVGRLDPEKGVDVLVEAANRWAKELSVSSSR